MPGKPQPAAAEPEPRDLREAARAVGERLARMAEDRVSRRRVHEDRWLADLRQYHGQYDPETLKRLKENEASEAFMNLTQPKTDSMAARLIDMLFPVDDSNWSIGPTPVPEMALAADRYQKAALDADRAVQAAGDTVLPELLQAADAAKVGAITTEAELSKARVKAEAMEREIRDLLVECRYEAQARDVIEDACRLGIGVMKGPVLGTRIERKWRKREVQGATVHELHIGPQPKDRPGFVRIDPWSFFPDPDARTVAESEGVFVRHLMKERQLRGLANLPGFDRGAIRLVLKSGARDTTPQYLLDLRTVVGETDAQIVNPFWTVWEYIGPLPSEDVATLARAMGDDEFAGQCEGEDPLREINVVVWFCQGQLLKFALHPLDSGDPPFSVFTLSRDDSSVLGGYGVPAMMRAGQAALNAAWRMMMDNAALGTGSQVVVSQDQVEPQDGKWMLKPRKVWLRKAGAETRAPAFETYDIPMHQQELANIISLALQMVDITTSMPQIAQGEQGTGVTRTAQGMALLMNSANVVFRRSARNFDDDFTVPNIMRAYDWLMQFSDKDGIKGDYKVDARGSSILLMREMQAQNLMAMAANFSGHPEFGPAIKKLEMLREIYRAHMLPPGRFVLSDQEFEAERKRAAMEAATAGAGDPDAEAKRLELEERKVEASIQMANLDASTRLKIAEMQRDVKMTDTAEKLNAAAEKAQAAERIEARRTRSKERVVSAEASMAARIGKGGGGHI